MTPAKMPDQPTTRALAPHITSFGPLLILNSSAGRQQAFANSAKLTTRPLFIYFGIVAETRYLKSIFKKKIPACRSSFPSFDV
jgi:hypothetical protein